MSDCIFCKIAKHEIQANIIYEDEMLVAFHDLFPQAPLHILIIPKNHYATLNDVPTGEFGILGQMMQTAQQLAKSQGFSEQGFRLVMNCNSDGGQSVYHIHLHLLAGRTLLWPPG